MQQSTAINIDTTRNAIASNDIGDASLNNAAVNNDNYDASLEDSGNLYAAKYN